MSIDLREMFRVRPGPVVNSANRVREKRLRVQARESGLQLIRSNSRDPGASDYGTYALVDPVSDSLLLADPDSGYGMSLDDIERFLDELTAVSQRFALRFDCPQR